MVRVNHRDFLESLRRRGFTVLTENGRLGVHPAANLTDDDRASIRAHKAALVELLNRPPCPHCGEQALNELLVGGARCESCGKFVFLREYGGEPRPLVLKPCICGSRWWYVLPGGHYRCVYCNPPGDLSRVEAWIKARESKAEPIPAEVLMCFPSRAAS